MREELYINNERVDLAENSGITLKYGSNLFGDITQLTGNVSYTIKLPKTINNCRIMEGRHLISSTSVANLLNYRARYLRNGITVVGEASAHLMKITEDAFEIVLVWGAMVKLQTLLEEGGKLKDLNINSMIRFREPSVYDASASEGIIVPFMSWGDTRYSRLQPAMRASWILEQIAKKSGLTFNVPEDRKEFLERLLIPCTTREWNATYPSYTRCYLSDIEVEGGKFLFYNLEFSANEEEVYDDYIKLISGGNGLKILKEGKIKMELRFTPKVNVIVDIRQGNKYDDIKIPYETVDGVRILQPIEIEVKDARDCEVTFRTEDNFDSQDGAYYSMFCSYQPEFVEPGMEYPVSQNIPDIKQTDFILSVCVLGGMFATTGENPDEVNFITFDTLWENKSKAVDWSDKLLTELEIAPNELLFSSVDNNLAQENYLYYTKDENENIGYLKAYLVIYDSSLPKSRDMATIIFSPSSTRDNMAYIPLYTIENEIQKMKEKIHPRILKEINSDGVSTAVFKELELDKVIATNYKTYQKAVTKPITIKQDFCLDDWDLASLDYAVPVYLRQYGSYFAVVSIQVNVDGVSNCELIKI